MRCVCRLELDLRATGIRDAGAASLADWLSGSRSLTAATVYLAGNALTDRRAAHLATAARHLTRYLLDMRQNAVVGPDVLEYPLNSRAPVSKHRR